MLFRILADVVMLQVAVITAMAARLAYATFFEEVWTDGRFLTLATLYVSAYAQRAWLLTAICLGVFYLSGFYTYGRYYAGKYKALVVTQAVTNGYVIFAFLSYFFIGTVELRGRTVIVLGWALSVLLLVGSRLWSTYWQRLLATERESIIRKIHRDHPRVLVIGGAGYIGSALLPKLLDQGHRVRLLDLMVFGDEPIRKVMGHERLELVRGDFRHIEHLAESLRDVDTVVHLGAIVGDPACNLDESLTIDVNLSATRMIGELARSAGVQRFIFASTCSVYGSCDELLSERMKARPLSLYGSTKLASEQVLWRIAGERFQPTILRFGTIYGLSGRTRFDLVVNLMAAKAKIDGEIVVHGGDQWRPFVHVDDAAEAIALALRAPLDLVGTQVFNVGSDEQNHTIDQVAQIVHQQVIGASIRHVDGADNRNYRVDFSKIRNMLSFRPRWTIQDGVQQVVDAITQGDVTDYTDARYSNEKYFSQQRLTLTRDDWARQLIEDLARQ